ncbi:uncharacterized protein [Euwallacea similis]|uniref:uncharacterized protein isoform X1 n=1 Tax=Euwallacea similis TaxID=1736056 RepID=UPI00344D9E9F
MSPSVFGSTKLLSSRNQDLRMFTKPEQVRKVKRALFGPVDHKATQKFLAEELKKITIEKAEKWNINLKTGRSLNPDGVYDWRLATPTKVILPMRREVQEVDISTQYCELTEADLIRPRPIKCSSNEDHLMEVEHRNHQSRITDFMKATKRPLDVSKKQSSSDWNAEVPPKIARVDIVS